MKRMVIFICMVLGVCFFSFTISGEKMNAGSLLMSASKELSGQIKTVNPKKTLSHTHVNINYGKLPLYFIANKGQVADAAGFYARTSRYTLWLTRQGLVFDSVKKETAGKSGKIKTKPTFSRDVSRLMFLGANKKPEMVPVEEAALKINYLKGNDQSKWSSAGTSKAILYKGLYKNIDMKVYGIEKSIEYDWIVGKGGDPSEIRFQYDHVKATRIDNEGNLLVTTDFGDLVHKRPVSFQEIDGKTVPVDVTFKHIKENTYGFDVPAYNRNYPLVIDPMVLAWSTYLGGSDEDDAKGIAVDSSGYVYVAGYTYSTDFPVNNEYMTDPADTYSDAFIAKLDPSVGGAPQLLYCTYLGGDDDDEVDGMAIDGSGNVYVVGSTYSVDFPVVNEYMSDPGDNEYDMWVARLDPDLVGASSLLYSSYLGGYAQDVAYGIAYHSGRVYLTGSTDSDNFPLLNEYSSTRRMVDMTVTVMDLSESGADSLIYSTLIGGTILDFSSGIAVDSSGMVYVVGDTISFDFPTVNEYMTDPSTDFVDCVVFKLDITRGASGLLYSTYLGGLGMDEARGITVDDNGNVYLALISESTGFPTVNQYMTEPADGISADMIIAKLDTNRSGVSSLLYSTYMGGYGRDIAYDLELDDNGFLYVVGTSRSPDFPVLNELMRDPSDYFDDLIIMIMDLSQSGSDSLLFSTYLGGNEDEDAKAICLDGMGNIYVAGDTYSTNFPVVGEYMGEPGDSEEDALFFKLTPNGPTIATDAVTNIGAFTAEAGGEVADAIFPVTDRGLCWSTSPNPTTSNNTLSGGAGAGVISGSITGLTANTTYYVRAYAVNHMGTYYGNEVNFITGIPGAPTVSTGVAYNIAADSAYCSGNVTDDGGYTVTERGLCWSTSPNPTTADSRVTKGSGLGTFNGIMSPLSKGVTYYVRAYAVNSAGTGYGNQVSFTTTGGVSGTLATVTTGDVSAITGTSAKCGGNVVSAGSSAVILRGICWSTSQNPTLDDNVEAMGTGTGTFSGNLTGLTLGTTYYVRAFAVNNQGTAYGTEKSFVAAYTGYEEILVSRNLLNFASVFQSETIVTDSQTIYINTTGNGTSTWTATVSDGDAWLSCTPENGTGVGSITVSVNTRGMPVGNVAGTITVSNGYSSQTIAVYLKVYPEGETTKPFGSFETPQNGSTVMSSVPVTGWVLDDIGIERIGIYRTAVAGKESSGLIKIGDAVMVDGARPDIDDAYNGYPASYLAGWGYMLLSNYLPNNGNGTFTLVAKAVDKEGNELILGSKTITADNANAVKPFGAIDTPGRGGSASGSNYVNFGWALTPKPNTIPIDGSTITVWVDGVPLGNPVYNQYREDIATYFPGYNNTDGAVGYYTFDTTGYDNGVHTISWSVTDNAGNTDGIGSRFFIVNNKGENLKASTASAANAARIHSVPTLTRRNPVIDASRIRKAPVSRTPVTLKKGYHLGAKGQTLQPASTGAIQIESKETERIQLHLGNTSGRIVAGYVVSGKKLHPLPIGSTLDTATGVFYWQPPAGFYGEYRLVFLEKTAKGQLTRTPVNLKITAKHR